MNRRLSLYLMAIGAVTLWGVSFPLTKMALGWLGPTSIAFLRWTISAAVLAGWLARGRRMPMVGQVLRRNGRTAAWVALTGITLFYFLENLSLSYTTAINAGVLSNLTSVFMVLMGTLWLRERLAAAEWAAAAAAFAGAVLVSQGAGHLTLAGPGLLGDALMVLASFLGAIYSIGGKGLVARYPADVAMTAFAALGALFLLPLALWEGSSRGGFATTLLALPWQVWGALLLLGLGSGALANLWWMEILGRTDASRAALILFLIPVVSTALAVVILGEPLTLAIVAGGLLVLAGVIAVQALKSRGSPFSSKLRYNSMTKLDDPIAIYRESLASIPAPVEEHPPAIQRAEVWPYPDLVRLWVRMETSPFAAFPNVSFTVTDPDGTVAATMFMVEIREPYQSVTLHLRQPPRSGERYRLQIELSRDEAALDTRSVEFELAFRNPEEAVQP